MSLLDVPRDPSAPALLAPGRAPLTHGRLAQRIAETAAELRNLGLEPGDRVALALPGGPDLAVALLGAAATAVAAPLNPDLQAAEFDVLLERLRARALIVPEGSGSAVVDVARARGIHLLGLAAGRVAGEFRLSGQAVEGAGSALRGPSLLLFTSGTTARPKAVPLTAANLRASARTFVEILRLGAADRCLNLAPFHHAQGVVGALLPALAAGGSLVCTPGFRAESFAGWIAEFAPTWTTAGPTLHRAILDAATGPWPSLRFLRSVSAPLPPALLAALEARFGVPVVEGYGMTETGTIASNPLPPGIRKPGAVGRPAGVELRIREGEIEVRGPGVTAGYEDDPEANRAAFVEGWFRTGDLGALDPDGDLVITGRVKELINRAGEKISPGEIEAALAAHPDVAEAVAFPVPHAQLGEDVAAAVVARPGASTSEAVLRRFIAERLSAFKVPRRLLLLKEIPKERTGKVRRGGLAAALGLDGTAIRSAFEELSTPAERAMAALWAQVLDVEDVGASDSYFDLGGDSAGAARLFSEIERTTGKRLPLTLLAEEPTLRGLAAAVERSRPSRSCLARIQAGAGKTPFFCVHGMHGAALFLRPLALALGPARPVYGLQAPGLDGLEPPLDRVEDMARRYLAELEAFYPEGPVLLGGLSFGGFVALEMAQRLAAKGRRVERLVILDTRLPTEAVAGEPQSQLRRRYLDAQRVGMSPFSPAYLRRARVNAGCVRAMHAYEPRPYPGRVHLMWSTTTASTRELWSRIAQGGLETLEVEGTHEKAVRALRQGPVVEALVRWLP